MSFVWVWRKDCNTKVILLHQYIFLLTLLVDSIIRNVNFNASFLLQSMYCKCVVMCKCVYTCNIIIPFIHLSSVSKADNNGFCVSSLVINENSRLSLQLQIHSASIEHFLIYLKLVSSVCVFLVKLVYLASKTFWIVTYLSS